jgi:serine phosphatase RsbU (regulator of sigma subunit)
MSSTPFDSLDSVLARQLKKAGVSDLDAPPDPETWANLVARLNSHYKHVAEDREMLTRSLEIATTEMEASQRKLTADRESLSGLVNAIGDALNVFGEVTRLSPETASIEDATGAIETAKREFLTRVEALQNSAYNRTPSTPVSQEIAEIRASFASLATQLVRMIRDTADGISLRKEFEVAKAVQQLLFPEEDVVERPFAKLAAFFRAASTCGGDWWTAHDLPDGKLLVVIGDVTGHGISSAIITGAAKAACDLARTLHGDKLKCEDLLSMMNRSIDGAAKQQLLMTCQATIIDPHTRTITLANAGHSLPYLVRRAKQGVSVQQLPCHGAPLGAMRESVYTPYSFRLFSGDLMLWYTDGITDCENAQGEQFSQKRLRTVLDHAAQWEPTAIRDTIVHTLSRYTESVAPNDDMTFVVGRFNVE